MKIEIVLNGRLKNKVIDKTVTPAQLVPYIIFMQTHGLFVEDAWYPPTRIKEIRFDEPAAPLTSRQFMVDDED